MDNNKKQDLADARELVGRLLRVDTSAMSAAELKRAVQARLDQAAIEGADPLIRASLVGMLESLEEIFPALH